MYKKNSYGLKCPVCGSENVYWCGHYYVSLQCDDCKFEVYPEDEFASEEEFIDEWNSYENINELLKLHENNPEIKNSLISKKKLIDQLREEQQRLLNWSNNLLARGISFWLFS